MESQILRYTKNSKTLRGPNPAFSFSIPAGHSCPAANICKTFADFTTGKLTKGAHQEFNCYAAKIEARYPSARRLYWQNFEILRACKNKPELLQAELHKMIETLPRDARFFRIHSSGDFYSENYAKAWYAMAKHYPDIVFYGYSKMLYPFELKRRDNWRWTYSHGGLLDAKAVQMNLPTCYVITKQNKDKWAHIEVDHTESDEFAKLQDGTRSFGLLYH